MKVNAKILICYNSPVSIFSVYNGKPKKHGIEQDDLSEKSFSREMALIKKSLSMNYSTVESLAVDKNISRVINRINQNDPDIIFNFVESVEGIATYEYCMAGVYELLGYSYTGNPPSTLANCLNKDRAKKILQSFNIPTPAYLTIKYPEKVLPKNFKLKFPVILKLLNEDASIGISEFSVVNNFNSLKKQLKFLFDTYKQDVIVEEYIVGRELNVAVLGSSVLPVSEIEFKGLPDGMPKIVTYDGKWISDSVYYDNTKPKCPAKLNSRVRKLVEETALASFEALNCRDYARVDLRLSESGTPFVIEVNPNPDISTDSGFARAASAAGLQYHELLNTIANFALLRKKNDTKNKAG
ncbi:MAG: ATP-grasp domain-containing protein [Ignavibacteriales bacterium]|nr:MAG: ATP-grasp domain-containing protein [Ignavibacteriales bacterium]